MGLTAYIRRQFKNGVSVTDTVPAGFLVGATSFTAADGTTFPDGSVGPFIITAAQGNSTEEKILIQSRSGAVFTVASGGRGYNGTTASAQPAGVSILHTIDAQDMDEANNTMSQTIGAIQASGDLLQGSAANTLTRLARGAGNSFLQVVGTSLAWTGFGSGGTTAIASSGADGTSTAPARYDHTHSGVTTVNGSAGAVTAVASLNGGTGALSQTNGYGVTGANSNPPVPAVSLTTASGTLGSPYTTTASMATFLTTASLGAGTWLVTLNGTTVVTALQAIAYKVAVGTATATFAGPTSGSSDSMGATGPSGWNSPPLSLTTIVTVTIAGTLVFQAQNFGGGTAPVIEATTAEGASLANATGYTATRIA